MENSEKKSCEMNSCSCPSKETCSCKHESSCKDGSSCSMKK